MPCAPSFCRGALCLCLALVSLVASSCGGAAPSEALDPGPLLERAITAMGAVESASFEMTHSGAPVTVEGLAFESAVGRYAAPDSAEAVLRVRANDLVVQLGTISVGERTWLTNPLTGSWEELAPGTGFNPAVLFDPDMGWVALLTDLTDVSFVATEGATDHLRATVPPARLEALTAGLTPGQSAPVDIWLDSATGHITRLEFSTQADAGQSDWVITLSQFDQPVQIEPPAVG
jgi:hypothetical protein